MSVRERRHLIRVVFWTVQIPVAVLVALYRPEWERGLFTYLVVISIAALVESAATDYFAAKAKRELDQAADIVTAAAEEIAPDQMR